MAEHRQIEKVDKAKYMTLQKAYELVEEFEQLQVRIIIFFVSFSG